ncbi:MAG TPA: STAS/SEC14 domain-containing protein [Tepidisphaeraceae bacterium]|jgi:hypothetical protein|nr:STAS/SEC14 domain-containing protein [Tepidisphaeraceae bacterium]
MTPSTLNPSDPEQAPHPPGELTDGIRVISEGDGKVMHVEMTGKLHKSDYDHFVPRVERAISANKKVRILVHMHRFHGWDAGALWQDAKFDLKHFNHMERLAIVGETTWEKWMAVFCKPFTTATIRYFTSEEMEEAKRWIAEP